jgi:hypothetical protein
MLSAAVVRPQAFPALSRDDSLSGRPWDPYLLWAELTDFLGYARLARGPGGPAMRVAVLLELDKAYGAWSELQRVLHDVASLQVPAMYFMDPLSPFVTATVDRAELQRLLSSPHVLRAQLGSPRTPAGRIDLPGGVRAIQGRRLVIGVVDDVCAYANRKFRNADGSTRIEVVWSQDVTSPLCPSPAEAGYGSVRRRSGTGGAGLQPATPSFAMSDYDWYRDANVQDARLWPGALHGTHVLDIAAGSPCPAFVDDTQGPPADAAGAAAIAFVELPQATVADVSGASLGNAALDAIRFLMAQAPDKETNLVVNISYGHFAGPHDPSGLFTRALHHLLDQRKNFTVTVPAGNTNFQGQPIHALCGTLAPSQEAVLELTVLPQDLTPTFLEVWVPAHDANGGAAQLSFSVQAPDGAVMGPVFVGQAGELADVSGVALPVAALSYFHRPAQGLNGRMALLSVAPTASSSTLPSAPAGLWKLTVKNHGQAVVGDLHAWVERHDVMPGTPNSGMQPFLVTRPDGGFALTGKKFTLNAIAHGSLTLCAGGLVLHHDPATGVSHNEDPFYAGNGPGRNCNAAPVVQALSDAGLVREGVRATGTLSGSTVEMSGTSASSAVLARHVANLLHARAPLRGDEPTATTIRSWFAPASPGQGVAVEQIDQTLDRSAFP